MAALRQEDLRGDLAPRWSADCSKQRNLVWHRSPLSRLKRSQRSPHHPFYPVFSLERIWAPACPTFEIPNEGSVLKKALNYEIAGGHPEGFVHSSSY